MALVVVFGGTGFLGRYAVPRLARSGWRVRVGTRNPDLAGSVRVHGDVGQVEPVAVDVRHERSVRAALAGADAAVNLVGILHEGGRQRFESVHAEGAGRIAALAAELGVRRLVQVSAIGADPDSLSLYARSKAEGERGAAAHPAAVILRPSVLFGEGDQFFNRFARMAELSPVLPVVGGGTRFQPAHVDDVAAAVVQAVSGRVGAGIYELGGPLIYTFRELMEIMLGEIRRRRLVVSVPFPVARILGRVLSLLPNPPLTADQVALLRTDNIVAAGMPGFADLDISPTSLESVIGSYLVPYRPGGQYSDIIARV